MHFKKIDPPDMLRQIIEQIKLNISAGELKKGDKLPSERLMCAMFGLSRSTVREALKTLEILGLIECMHGSGYYISSNLSNAISEPLSIMMLLERGGIMHTHELRRALELESAGLAATNTNDSDIAAMESLITRISKEPDEQVKAALDQQFHYAIARSTGNPLLMTLLNACESLINEHIHDARIHIIRSGNNEELINLQHAEILDAIKAHDSFAATQAVSRHMELIANSLVKNDYPAVKA